MSRSTKTFKHTCVMCGKEDKTYEAPLPLAKYLCPDCFAKVKEAMDKDCPDKEKHDD